LIGEKVKLILPINSMILISLRIMGAGNGQHRAGVMRNLISGSLIPLHSRKNLMLKVNLLGAIAQNYPPYPISRFMHHGKLGQLNWKLPIFA